MKLKRIRQLEDSIQAVIDGDYTSVDGAIYVKDVDELLQELRGFHTIHGNPDEQCQTGTMDVKNKVRHK